MRVERLVTLLAMLWLLSVGSHPGRAGERNRRPFRKFSNEELLAYMAPGGTASHVPERARIPTHVPEGFWELPPREAALSFADANRTEGHRKLFRLGISAAGGEPPAWCTVRLSTAWTGCFGPEGQWHTFLVFHPRGSRIVRAVTSGEMTEPRGPFHVRPRLDLRALEVPTPVARQTVRVLWQLFRLHSRYLGPEPRPRTIVGSHPEGSAELEIREARGVTLHVRGTLFCGNVSECWRDAYELDDEDRPSHDVFLMLAAYLLERALPEHLAGARWFRPDAEGGSTRDWPLAENPEEARRRAHWERISRSILRSVTRDETRVSFEISRVAARLAGELGLTGLAPDLRALLGGLGEEEMPGDRSGPREALREEARHGLRRLAVAAAPEALRRVALSRGDDRLWAADRLRALDPAAYAEVLEAWIREREGEHGPEILEELARVDRDRALALARELTPTARPDLVCAGLRLLAGEEEVPEETRRVEAVLAILGEREGDARSAIDALVPPRNPHRWTSAEIDAALLALIGRDREKDEWTLAHACRALALRGRRDSFARIVEVHRTVDDEYVKNQTLQALALLAIDGTAEQRGVLMRLVRAGIRRGDDSTEGAIWAAWIAGLRDLAPELAKRATSGPDQAEGGGRWHMARKVLALWRTRDPWLKVRLLVTLAMGDASIFWDEDVERRIRLVRDVREVSAALSPEAIRKLGVFLAWGKKRWAEEGGAETVWEEIAALFRAG